MTYLDAAHTILKTAGQPLHYEEITQRALAQGLIQPSGLTPAATMGSRLYTDTLQEDSRFVRSGKGIFELAQWQPKGIEYQVGKLNQDTRERLYGLLFEMPPDRFEALIGELLIRMGFDENTVAITRHSKDGGIDVTGVYRVAGLADVSAAVQVKRWKDNVGAPVVTQLRGSLQVHQQGIIISTSDFSKGARAEAAAASKSRIGLIKGTELVDLLVRHKVGVHEKNLPVLSLDKGWWGELSGQSVSTLLPAQPAGLESDGRGQAAETTGKMAANRPVAFTFMGQRYTFVSWRDVLLQSCTTLADRHGPAFAEAAFTVKGRKRQYVAASGEGMITPVQIPGTELWVEANQSAKSVVQVIERLLAALGHEAGELAIMF